MKSFKLSIEGCDVYKSTKTGPIGIALTDPLDTQS